MSDASTSITLSEDPVDVVEAFWARSGEAPDQAAFLASRSHWLSIELRATLLVDQQFRSRTHQSWSTEEYAAMVPTLAADDDFTLELIFGELRGRSHQGQPPSLLSLPNRTG